MAHINLYFLTHWLFGLVAEFLFYLEKAFFDFLLHTGIQLLLHVVKFKILPFKLLKWSVLTAHTKAVSFAWLDNILLDGLIRVIVTQFTYRAG